MKRLLLVAILSLAGCLGTGYSMTERITNACKEYVLDVRWARYDEAAKHVPSEQRDRWVEKRTALEDELEISDAEIININVDKKASTATARVEYIWTLKRRGIMEKTVTEQQWEQKGMEWVVKSETRVKGTPLTLFAERPVAKAANSSSVAD